MKREWIAAGALVMGVILTATVRGGEPPVEIPALRVQGQDLVDAEGRTVRFWGVNTVSLFPTHQQAEAIADHLFALQVNLVRPHHVLRPSSDWITQSRILALSLYKGNSRDPDPEAWDRFDYLNAELRKRGIYLAFSLHWSRGFLPGDGDILSDDPADTEAWKDAMEELNSWNWKQSIDPMKMLPTIDKRCQLLQEEFTIQLLTHVNPYTGIAYGRDPQVLTIEIVNESSAEYCLICRNKFPAYFMANLTSMWETFAAANGVEPGDLMNLKRDEQLRTRAAFYRKLDEDHFKRMKALVRKLGCTAAVTYSNLWRGESNLHMHAEHSDQIEDHAYADPRVAWNARDLVFEKSRTALAHKPYFIGELNMSEWGKDVEDQKPYRTMLQLAASAYGSLQGWSGLVWFAWNHGDRSLGTDGWAETEGRKAALGDMMCDGMMLDHMRTCGMILRRGLVRASIAPVTLYVDKPLYATDYHGLMKGRPWCKPGWQSIHAIRKAFGAVPYGQAEAPWMTEEARNPLVSDTGEIVKDMERGQLTVSAPQAEAFSGSLDGSPPQGLRHLRIEGADGFATVVLVAADGELLTKSGHLVVSRTRIGPGRQEQDGLRITLAGLNAAAGGKTWRTILTRPRANADLLRKSAGVDSTMVEVSPRGVIALPAKGWHECELIRR